MQIWSFFFFLFFLRQYQRKKEMLAKGAQQQQSTAFTYRLAWLQVQFCFYRQAVKAKTVGWNEQKNHSVHCYAAKSGPRRGVRRLWSSFRLEKSGAVSTGTGFGTETTTKKSCFYAQVCDRTVSSLTFGPAFSCSMLTARGMCAPLSQRLLWCCQFLPPQPMFVKVKPWSWLLLAHWDTWDKHWDVFCPANTPFLFFKCKKKDKTKHTFIYWQ